MKFKKYQHLEKLGNTEVEGILEGNCHIFPKIDGTNASVWLGEDGVIKAGSRNRELSLDNDNAGFYQSIINCEKTKAFFEKNPTLRLYAEWLVPHSLKTYEDNAWRKFYIFDVTCAPKNDATEDAPTVYLPYDVYKELLDEADLNYIAPLFSVENPTQERIFGALEKNNYLIKNGEGVGEGVVVKNYSFVNRFGRTAWAKLITSEFKDKHVKAMGAPVVVEKLRIEDDIAEEFVTAALVDKVHAKILLECGLFSSKHIARLLETVYYDLVREEIWQILKKYKQPIIDFKDLKRFTINRIKKLKPELF